MIPNTIDNPMTKYVQCASVPCVLPEEMARDVDALSKTLPEGCGYVQKAYASEFQFEPGERAEVSIISTDHKDYSSEVIIPSGIELTEFRKHSRVLWNHNRELPPVASCQWIKLHNNSLRAKTMYPESPVASDDAPWFVDELWQLVTSGVLTCKSIGCLARKPKREPTADELRLRPDWEGALLYDDMLMLEYSLVPIPCNSEAVVQFVNRKSYGSDQLAILTKALGVELPPKVEGLPPAPVKRQWVFAQSDANNVLKRKHVKKKVINWDKLVSEVINKITPNPDRIARLAEMAHRNRGRV